MSKVQRQGEEQATRHLQQGRLKEAEALYRRLIEEGAVSHTIFGNLAAVYGMQDRTQEMIPLLKRAIAIKPDFADAYSNLGIALYDQGDLQAAVNAYRQALVIKPNHPEAYSNLGIVLSDQGNLQAAVNAYHQALAIKPNCLKAQHNLAQAQLLSGDYENGWENYECRFKKKDLSPLCAQPKVKRWSGGKLDPSKELIIVSEQGLGDTLHFMRYVYHLNNTGQPASICASRKLHTLIKASGITQKIYSPEETNQLTLGEWMPLLSLPAYLKVSPDHPIVTAPYIHVPEPQIKKWRQRLAHEQRPIVGINWQGNPSSEKINTRGRSLPLETFATIPVKTTASLLSLQKGHGSEQLETCSFRHRFVNCQEEINQTWDFVDTAAMIANCDLVITSDTSVAHLAAGMGHPTWLLLAKVPEWRWGLTGDTTFWYPSMRLFRQQERGNWAEVMESVVTAFQELTANDKQTPACGQGEGVSDVSSRPAPIQSTKMSKAQCQKEQEAMRYAQQGRLKEAEVLYRRLIKEGAISHTIFGNLAVVYGIQGRTQEMIPLLKRAIAIKPDFAEAYSNLGIALYNQSDLQAAINAYRQALAVKPNYPEAYYNLGVALKDQGDLQAAVNAYRQALAIKPNYPEAYSNLGIALSNQGDLQAAINSYRQALDIKPNYPEAHYNLGNVLIMQGDLQAAVSAYRQALAIKPNYPEAYSNLGIALSDQGDLQAAVNAYHQALAIKPNYPEAHYNLGNALIMQSKLQAAVNAYHQALAIKPNYLKAQNNLAQAQLLSGDYENGWENYECRFKKKDLSPLCAQPKVKRWSGGKLDPSKELIIVSEQGLGDTLHFMRYVYHLNNTGQPAPICAPTKLHALIKASGITQKIYSPEETNQLILGEWMPLLSLPAYLKVSPDHPIVTAPYIHVPEPQISKWRQKLAHEQRPVVGINWQGNPSSEKTNSRGRSLPLETFATIPAKTTASLLSLQKGHGSEQLEECSFRHRFVSCQEEINQTWDFVETAAMIANCDLVITSDTSVAHLAAGMGHPTWLLLTKVPEWRWGMEGDTTFWYPSMRLFRQQERGNWAEVMERVATALQEFTANTKPNSAPG